MNGLRIGVSPRAGGTGGTGVPADATAGFTWCDEGRHHYDVPGLAEHASYFLVTYYR